MGFWGNHFSFDGIACEEFGLALIDIGSYKQDEDGAVASAGEIIEDWVPSRNRSYFYGIQQNTPLTFRMVFGVDPELTDLGQIVTMDDYFDRWEITEINNWLTGHNERKWLEIEQPDMETVRFFCTITDLSVITPGWCPWAFSCTVTCDSAYGYQYPKTYHYSVSGSTSVTLKSKNKTNEPYYPIMYITPRNVTEVSIKNVTDGSAEFLLSNIPISAGVKITVDNDRGIITTTSDINIYDSFNFKFLRILPGNNVLNLRGYFDIDIVCEFPVNIGG